MKAVGLNAVTGRVEWQRQLPGLFSGWSGSSFLSVVAGRLTLPVALPTGRTFLAYGLDGELHWTYANSAHVSSSFSVFGPHLYVDGERVTALDAASGRVVTEREFPIRMTGTASSGHGPVFKQAAEIGFSACVGLNPQSLETVWKWPQPDAIVRGSWLGQIAGGRRPHRFVRIPDLFEVSVPAGRLPYALDQDAIFSPRHEVWCAFNRRIAAAVSLPSGSAAWRRKESDDGHHRVLWSTADRAYAGVTSLSAYDLSDGALIWRRLFAGEINHPSSGTLTIGYVLTEKQLLHRVNLETGETAERFQAPGEIRGMAAIDDSRVAIATRSDLMCVVFE